MRIQHTPKRNSRVIVVREKELGGETMPQPLQLYTDLPNFGMTRPKALKAEPQNVKRPARKPA